MGDSAAIQPISVAVDSISIYIADYDAFNWVSTDAKLGPRIVKCPLDGCGATGGTVFVSGSVSPYALAVDNERLYFTNFEQGDVVSLPK